MNNRSFHVVDPDPGVRQSLAAMLRTMGAQAHGFDHAEALLDALAGNRVAEPDAVICELRLPGMQGLRLLETLGCQRPGVPVIMVSAWADVPSVNASIRAGALACIEKPWRELELTDLLAEAVAQRDRAQTRLARLRHAVSSAEQLSDRERVVFRLMCDGRLNKQIATDLGISERTVEAHRAKVIAKFGVDSFAALVRVAVMLEQHGTVTAVPQPVRLPAA
jgi:FixJ family two-component response regulator